MPASPALPASAFQAALAAVQTAAAALVSAVQLLQAVVADALAADSPAPAAAAPTPATKPEPPRKTSTARVRRFRARRRADPRQLSLLLPIAGTVKPMKRDEGVSCVSSRVSCVSHRPKSTTYDRFPLIERILEDSDSLSNAVLKGGEPKNINRKESSKRFALFARPPPAIIRAKRENLIKTLDRWARFAPELADDDRLHRLAMLDRARLALDDWEAGRTAADKRAFDALARAAARRPLDLFTVAQIRNAERQTGPPGAAASNVGGKIDTHLGAILARAGWYHGKAA